MGEQRGAPGEPRRSRVLNVALQLYIIVRYMYSKAQTESESILTRGGRSVRVMDLAEIVTNQLVRSQNEEKPWTVLGCQMGLRYLIVTV